MLFEAGSKLTTTTNVGEAIRILLVASDMYGNQLDLGANLLVRASCLQLLEIQSACNASKWCHATCQRRIKSAQ